MKIDGDDIEVTSEEASGGAAPQNVRIVLAVSLGLAIILMAFAWMLGADWN
jgi:hypothetical protein